MLDHKNNNKLSNCLEEMIINEKSSLDTELQSLEDRSREFSEADIQSSGHWTDENVIISAAMFEKDTHTAKGLHKKDKTIAKNLSPCDEDETNKKFQDEELDSTIIFCQSDVESSVKLSQ